MQILPQHLQYIDSNLLDDKKTYYNVKSLIFVGHKIVCLLEMCLLVLFSTTLYTCMIEPSQKILLLQ